MIIVPANTLAAGGFEVANSCRFNPGDAPELSRSTGDGNEDVGSFSFWWKPDKEGGATFYSIYVDSSNFFTISVDGGGNFQVLNKLSGSYNMQFESSATFRDPSAWYHFCVLIDTTQSTEANRMKAYVNGTQITSWQTATYPSQNTDMIMNSNSRTAYISHSGDRMHGYLAEFVLIDGTAKVVGDFGEYDEDSPTIWKPKDVSELSGDKGVNGFYLDFEDSSALGNCAFGGTDFTVSNLAATDQSTDTPTNNFNVMLPIMKQASNLTFSEGNLAVAYPSANTWRTIYSSIMPTAGKWYWEVKPTASADRFVGIVGEAGVDNTDDSSLGVPATAYSIKEDGNKYNNNSSASYGVSTTTNDIVGVAMDLDNGTVWFSKNGTWMNSATQAEVAAGTTTNAAYSSITVGATYPYGPAVAGKESAAFSFNFGSPPYAISSGNADGNGYGNFEYAVPSNFYSLCTKNLAEYG